MGKIYDDNGYLNYDYLYPECRFIMAITGPRGTGKTYGLLKYIVENDIRFLYIRRLKAQLDTCTSEDKNPFKSINTDTGRDISAARKKDSLIFTMSAKQGPRLVIGYGASLSTMATIRGADYSDVECIIFDEYIAMKGERPIPDEAGAFKNLIETVNRNRELNGRPPVKCFLLGNANKLMNPYFLEWHFMKTALKMIRGGQMMYRTQDNNRIMIMLLNSPISEKKKETALYQNESSAFFGMAIDNAFETDATNIQSIPLSDCQHIVSIGTIGIYRRKSTGKNYVSETISKRNYYPENDINIKFFRARYAGFKLMYLYDFFTFENFDCELLFREYIGVA